MRRDKSKKSNLPLKLILIALNEAERPVMLLDLFPVSPNFFARFIKKYVRQKRK